MPSSNPYTYAPVKAKRSGALATTLIGVGALAGGIVFGLMPNGGLAALFPASPTPTNTRPTGPQTADGDAIDYQFGTVQVSVTRDNGTITAVDLLQAGANGGREQAFPILQQAVLDANGTNFGNVSGATYTTDAFKASLDSAIARLP